ncbi:MAG: hypothetical protein ACMXYG_07520 [Candidatus Woesearchaeota archaeon]
MNHLDNLSKSVKTVITSKTIIIIILITLLVLGVYSFLFLETTGISNLIKEYHSEYVAFSAKFDAEYAINSSEQDFFANLAKDSKREEAFKAEYKMDISNLNMFLIVIYSIFGVVVIIPILIYLICMQYCAIVHEITNKKTNLKSISDTTSKIISKYIRTIVLILLLVIAIITVLILLFLSLGVISLLGKIGMIIGLIMIVITILAIPFLIIFLSIKLFFIYPIIFMEQGNARDSIKKSFEFSKGKVKKILLIGLIILLINVFTIIISNYSNSAINNYFISEGIIRYGFIVISFILSFITSIISMISGTYLFNSYLILKKDLNVKN